MYLFHDFCRFFMFLPTIRMRVQLPNNDTTIIHRKLATKLLLPSILRIILGSRTINNHAFIRNPTRNTPPTTSTEPTIRLHKLLIRRPLPTRRNLPTRPTPPTRRLQPQHDPTPRRDRKITPNTPRPRQRDNPSRIQNRRILDPEQSANVEPSERR